MVLLLGIWIIAPRFAIAAPSIVDDWSAIDNAPRALDRLVRLDYEPDAVKDPHRYRPGYTAAWSSLQWRTLDAPDSLTGPNLWNALRLALFVAALVAVPLGVARSFSRPAIGPIWIGLLAAATPAMVLATPKSGEDFARFGPVEPLLVAGMTLGATLLVLATARFIRSERRPLSRGMLAPAALAVVGYGLWLLGVYQKEASVCFLVMAPFLYLYLARHWRESGSIDRPLYRYRAFQIVAVAMLLPVLHMTVELARLAGEGTTVYGAAVPSGTGGVVTRLRSAFDTQWRAISPTLGTSLWKELALVLPLLLVVVAIQRRRVPWLALGLVVTGWATFVFQGLSDAVTARYYLPTMALFGVAAALLLARSGVWLRVAAIAVATIFVLGNAGSSRDTVETRVEDDKDGNRAVALVAGLNPERCPVYMSGVEEEVADAFPELVALRQPFPGGPCDGRYEAFLLRRQHPERITPVTNEAIVKSCERPGWTDYAQTEIWRILSCRRLKAGDVAGQPVGAILAEDRLVPGRRFSERSGRARQ